MTRLGLSDDKHALCPHIVVPITWLRRKVRLKVWAAAEDIALAVVRRQWPRSENIESDGAASHVALRVPQKHCRKGDHVMVAVLACKCELVRAVCLCVCARARARVCVCVCWGRAGAS